MREMKSYKFVTTSPCLGLNCLDNNWVSASENGEQELRSSA